MVRPVTFFAPSDLAAARVRVVGPSGKPQLAFTAPGHNFFNLDHTEPGSYVAVIEPLGQFPLTYHFELGKEHRDDVHAPLLADLRASELEKSLFQSGAVGEALEPAAVLLDERSMRRADMTIEDVRDTLEASARPREIAIGLSQDGGLLRGGWMRCGDQLRPRVDVVPGGVDVVFERTETLRSNPGDGGRLRLSVAIDNQRVTRMLVPLFSGGTRIALRASPLTTADLAARVVPLAPNLRALTQAMESGVGSEARVILEEFFKSTSSLESHFDVEFDFDPWTQALLALLVIRFPAAAGALPGEAVRAWAERTAWMADARVVAARSILTEAGQHSSDEALLSKATAHALEHLKAAREKEACYFAHANALWGEMLTSLAGGAVDADHRKRARKETDARQRNIRLERHAGVCFAWRAADFPDDDPRRGKDDLISAESARLLFRGRLDLTDIGPAPAPPGPASFAIGNLVRDAIAGVQSLTAGEQGQPSDTQSEASAPGLKRPVSVAEDPIKGRFGGQAARDGFTLGVSFGRERGGWVKLLLFVDAGSQKVSASDTAEFFLHDTFRPDRVCVRFFGARAQLPVTAWGGFTVGVWLPRQGVELELDLALAEGAPRIVREL